MMGRGIAINQWGFVVGVLLTIGSQAGGMKRSKTTAVLETTNKKNTSRDPSLRGFPFAELNAAEKKLQTPQKNRTPTEIAADDAAFRIRRLIDYKKAVNVTSKTWDYIHSIKEIPKLKSILKKTMLPVTSDGTILISGRNDVFHVYQRLPAAAGHLRFSRFEYWPLNKLDFLAIGKIHANPLTKAEVNLTLKKALREAQTRDQ